MYLTLDSLELNRDNKIIKIPINNSKDYDILAYASVSCPNQEIDLSYIYRDRLQTLFQVNHI